jgi:hypothetical protein
VVAAPGGLERVGWQVVEGVGSPVAAASEEEGAGEGPEASAREEAEVMAVADVPVAAATAGAVVGNAGRDASPVTVRAAGPVDAGPAPVEVAGCRSQPRIYGLGALRQRNQPR